MCFGTLDGARGGVGGAWNELARVIGGQIVLADLVDSRAAVQAPAQPVAFDASLIGIAFLWVKKGSIAIP